MIPEEFNSVAESLTEVTVTAMAEEQLDVQIGVHKLCPPDDLYVELHTVQVPVAFENP